ncbi:hypothetical protein Rumeso_00867 [Rubellimicrobium mesophilum DSM 19309]|uniref:Glycosyltransferase 61 catalytic domain-containing protein n=2 Tax=Rubellimicrobium TaxID=295418 RepID=A0A017HTI2_9RHOB|nr:hypothetical protein Rumeso_00867 [Rubellimicrobium mesophilum DSM 19309]
MRDYVLELGARVLWPRTRTVLTEKYLSDLDAGDLSLQPGASDRAILLDDGTFTGKDPFCRTERSPYVVQLADCTLYPAHTIRLASRGPEASRGGSPGRKAADRFVRKPGNLIVTRDGGITCGSLSRDGTLPPIVRPAPGAGAWEADLPKAVDQIDEPVVFIDLICGQFGHALVDTPSRLWYRLEPSLELLRGLPVVGFGTHGIGLHLGRRKPSGWPSYLRLVLAALGVEPEKVRVVTAPTRCRSVFIPKRLSPYWGKYGYSHRYLDAMQAAGDALARSSEARTTPRRVYLSRSKLDRASRRLMDGQELQIEEIFRQHGFEIVHPQMLSLPEQIRTVRDADHVAGCVGSQMHLLAFARCEGKRVLRIAPSFFDTPIDRIMVESGGGEYSEFVVERDAKAGTKPSETPWRLTEEDLTRLRRQVGGWVDGATGPAMGPD